MKSSDVLVLALLALLGIIVYLRKPVVYSQETVQNAETWEWIDAFGNHRSITVHRDVRAS